MSVFLFLGMIYLLAENKKNLLFPNFVCIFATQKSIINFSIKSEINTKKT